MRALGRQRRGVPESRPGTTHFEEICDRKPHPFDRFPVLPCIGEALSRRVSTALNAESGNEGDPKPRLELLHKRCERINTGFRHDHPVRSSIYMSLQQATRMTRNLLTRASIKATSPYPERPSLAYGAIRWPTTRRSRADRSDHLIWTTRLDIAQAHRTALPERTSPSRNIGARWGIGP